MAERISFGSYSVDMNTEIFVPVPIEGLENRYEVSNFGRIKSLPKYTYSKGYPQLRKERILKGHIDGAGYVFVTLSFGNNKLKDYKVHRLVAQAFIPNYYDLPQVNHKDENKQNNRVDNLEWCNNAYNIKYSAKPLTEEHKQKISKGNKGKVRTAEHKKAYKRGTLKRYENADERKKTSEAIKNWWESRR